MWLGGPCYAARGRAESITGTDELGAINQTLGHPVRPSQCRYTGEPGQYPIGVASPPERRRGAPARARRQLRRKPLGAHAFLYSNTRLCTRYVWGSGGVRALRGAQVAARECRCRILLVRLHLAPTTPRRSREQRSRGTDMKPLTSSAAARHGACSRCLVSVAAAVGPTGTITTKAAVDDARALPRGPFSHRLEARGT